MPIKSKSKPTTSLSKKKDASPPPKWPPLKPLVPTSDLVRETLLENQIVVIRNFFTSSLCKTYVSFLSSLPLVTTPGQPKRGDAVRVNDRFQVDDPSFAESLWKSAGLEDLVTRSDEDNGISQQTLSQLWGGEVCGLNPKIRIYRYSKGQFFSQHCRCPNSFVSVLFYYNDCHHVGSQERSPFLAHMLFHTRESVQASHRFQTVSKYHACMM